MVWKCGTVAVSTLDGIDTATTGAAAAASNGHLQRSENSELLQPQPSAARYSRKLRSSSPCARGPGATTATAAGGGGEGGLTSAGRTSLMGSAASVANLERPDRAVIGAAAATAAAATGAADARAGEGSRGNQQEGGNVRGGGLANGGTAGGGGGGGGGARGAHEVAPSLAGRSGEVAATDGMSSKPKPGARVTAGETEILPRPAAEGKTEREARKRRRENGVNDLRVGALKPIFKLYRILKKKHIFSWFRFLCSLAGFQTGLLVVL